MSNMTKIIKNSKRKYEQRVLKNIVKNPDFLIERIKNEWESVERAAKKEKIIRYAKEGGIFIARSILGLAAIGGVLTVALVAPNVLGAIGKLDKHRQFYNKKDFKKTVTYLKYKGYINVNEEGKDGYKIALTARGLRSTALDAFKNLGVSQEEKEWDGFWRIITFDIPRTRNSARDVFREKLRSLGFYKLHASVFVTPFACEKELGYLISVLEISPYVHVIKATEVSVDESLKEHFRLR